MSDEQQMTGDPGSRATAPRRVRVWLGEHIIVDHITKPDDAAPFEQAMRRRFACCRVTSDSLTARESATPY